MIQTICLNNEVMKHMLWVNSAEARLEELFLSLTSSAKGENVKIMEEKLK